MSESLDERLSDEEFTQLARLLRRYSATDLDQFDHWKFDLPNCSVYVDLSLKPSHEDTDDWYTNLSHLLI